MRVALVPLLRVLIAAALPFVFSLAVATPGAAASSPERSVVAHTYDDHGRVTSLVCEHTAYDAPLPLAQIDISARTTARFASATIGDRLSPQQGFVAANKGPTREVPTSAWTLVAEALKGARFYE